MNLVHCTNILFYYVIFTMYIHDCIIMIGADIERCNVLSVCAGVSLDYKLLR